MKKSAIRARKEIIMNKKQKIAVGVVVALFASLGIALGVLYAHLTAQTAPAFERVPAEDLGGRFSSSLYTGDPVQITAAELNAILSENPEAAAAGVLGAECAPDNTLVLWCSRDVLGKTCYVRVETALDYDPVEHVLSCTVRSVQVGKLTIPQEMLPALLEKEAEHLPLEGNRLSVDLDEAIPLMAEKYIGETKIVVGNFTLDLKAMIMDSLKNAGALVKDIRCDAAGMYIDSVDGLEFINLLLSGGR